LAKKGFQTKSKS